MALNDDDGVMRDPNATLDRIFIEEYLRTHGYVDSPEPRKAELLKEAAVYAAVKLAELEARAHYLHDSHGTAER